MEKCSEPTFSLRLDIRTTTPGMACKPLAIGCGVAGFDRAIASSTARKFARANGKRNEHRYVYHAHACMYLCICTNNYTLRTDVPGFWRRAGDIPKIKTTSPTRHTLKYCIAGYFQGTYISQSVVL